MNTTGKDGISGDDTERGAPPVAGAPITEHQADGAPETLSEQALEAAIVAQREDIAQFEKEFVPMRRRYERLRGRLRQLEGERERRRLAAAGAAEGFKPIPRRSITVADAVLGREKNVAMDLPLARFTFLSMRRQPIVPHPEGDRERQRLTFYRAATGDASAQTAEATTFGEAKRLSDEGWTPGVPGVALNRLAVYYPKTSSPGWLRLDQMYFEEPT